MSGVRESFATVAEHIAAWKAGGRRWAKVAGFNVDAVQAERDAGQVEQARFDAVKADEATPAEGLAAAYCAKVEAARGSGMAEGPAAKRVEGHQGGAIRVRMMVAALELITRDGCETSTSGIGSCVTSRRTPDAECTADRWCRPCVAWHALNCGVDK